MEYGWKIIDQKAGYGDTTATGGTVTFAPGAKRRWIVTTVRVFITTESSAATRYPRLQHRDSGGTVLQEFVPDKGVAASDTGKYFIFGGGLSDMSDWKATDTSMLTTPIVPMAIPHDHDLNILLTNGKSDDTFMVYMEAWQGNDI